MDGNNRDAVFRLEVAEEHLPYVGPGAEMTEGDRDDGAIESYAIRVDGEVVGFLRLDYDRERVSEYAGGGDNCGLRGYLIGARCQGRGYGRAAIPDVRRLLRNRYPEIANLVLTVNLRNARAIPTYLGADFRDTGEIYRGGARGPQHVFALPLR